MWRERAYEVAARCKSRGREGGTRDTRDAKRAAGGGEARTSGVTSRIFDAREGEEGGGGRGG